MSKEQTHGTLEWSRWIVINGSDPEDVDPTKYNGPVVFRRNESTTIETGECGKSGITQNGVKVPNVGRWKPAPVAYSIPERQK